MAWFSANERPVSAIPFALVDPRRSLPEGGRIAFMRTVFYCHVWRLFENLLPTEAFFHFFSLAGKSSSAGPNSTQSAEFADW
jgi:hypothetical protein